MISTRTTKELSCNPIVVGHVDIFSKETSWLQMVSNVHLSANHNPQDT